MNENTQKYDYVLIRLIYGQNRHCSTVFVQNPTGTVAWDLSSHKFLLISNTGPLTPGIQSFGIHREEV